jgi:hypothetical protein
LIKRVCKVFTRFDLQQWSLLWDQVLICSECASFYSLRVMKFITGSNFNLSRICSILQLMRHEVYYGIRFQSVLNVLHFTDYALWSLLRDQVLICPEFASFWAYALWSLLRDQVLICPECASFLTYALMKFITGSGFNLSWICLIFNLRVNEVYYGSGFNLSWICLILSLRVNEVY